MGQHLPLARQSLTRGSAADETGDASAAAAAQTAAASSPAPPAAALEESASSPPTAAAGAAAGTAAGAAAAGAVAAGAVAAGGEEVPEGADFQTRRLSVAVDMSEAEALEAMIAQTDAASAAKGDAVSAPSAAECGAEREPGAGS